VIKDDPRISPTHLEDLTGIVSEEGGMLVLAGQAEVMRPDIAAFAKRASSAGVRVQYHEEPGEPHCYACLPMPHLKHKSKVIVDFIEGVVEGIGAGGDSSSTMSSSSSPDSSRSSRRSRSELSLSRSSSGACG
jgi:acetyl esterase/lipase